MMTGESEYSTMPWMRCPKCKKDWRWDDYYEVEEGDERECPHCGEIAVIGAKEILMECRLDPKVRPLASHAPEPSK